MCLLAAEIVSMRDPEADLRSLVLYVGTVMAGLAIHSLIILPTIYLLVVRKNPFKYMYGVFEALLIAFSTASRSARLLHVNPRLT